MSNIEQGSGVRSDAALEQLLKHASPRPVPSETDTAAARGAVRAEWQQVSGRRRVRRRMLNVAIAATVLVGVFSVFNTFRAPEIGSVQVASIEQSFGSVYVLGEESVLRETRDLSGVLSGQTIVTGDEAGMALAWGSGGSLRVDQKTRVEFTNDHSVYVQYGRVYFDSEPASLATRIDTADSRDFVVRTDLGEVLHTGTQFMSAVESDVLTVSVREGHVSVVGDRQDSVVAYSGEQVKLEGRQRPVKLSISRHGENWDWVNRASRTADVNGKTIDAFLTWVCRELGFELRYEGEAAEVAVRDTLTGDYENEPLEVLRLAMMTTALTVRVDETEGVIYVSD